MAENAIEVAAQLSDIQAMQTLAHYEAIIERGLKTFEEVGNALLTIRDSKLYRETGHKTFREYCRERWGFKESRTYQLMSAADVMGNLKTSTMVEVLPTTERQARPLTHLSPDQQQEAWIQAIESAPLVNGKLKITGAHVKQVVEDTTRPLSMAVHFSSETPEWYTPPEIIERVIAVMGAIDLDPCSSNGKPNIPAAQHLTANDNGLAQQWHGRVYMNPPYGREIAGWVEHLCEQYESGNTIEAIVLAPSRTDTIWFRRLREYPRCFVWGRLRFSGHDNFAPFPSMVVYLGKNLGAFSDAFSDIGDIYAQL